MYRVVCDTAKVRFFKQITTQVVDGRVGDVLFAILQKYDFSSKSQLLSLSLSSSLVVCDTAKVRFFKQITTYSCAYCCWCMLFAILQKYDFSSKSQRKTPIEAKGTSCLRYCKSTIFQANHNSIRDAYACCNVVCDTAKVRFFKQITTKYHTIGLGGGLFAILQKYDFSSKSQQQQLVNLRAEVVCDTAKVRFFKQITTRYAQGSLPVLVVCDTAKVRFFKQITTARKVIIPNAGCLRYCKSTIFQANHNLLL